MNPNHCKYLITSTQLRGKVIGYFIVVELSSGFGWEITNSVRTGILKGSQL